MKLLLTSAGLSQETTRTKLLHMVGKKPGEVLVGHIPTAADPEIDKWYIQTEIDEIIKLGMNLTNIDLKEETYSSLKDKLSACDVVYVNGGNTFYLLDWVRRSGFDQAIVEFINQGKVYMGASAGSIIMGPDIGCSGWFADWDKNLPGLTDLAGLKIIPYAIIPHFTEALRTDLKAKVREIHYPVKILTDNQAIALDGDHEELVGGGEEIAI
jgi:dipeptidase E